jgi:hypothetical protein
MAGDGFVALLWWSAPGHWLVNAGVISGNSVAIVSDDPSDKLGAIAALVQRMRASYDDAGQSESPPPLGLPTARAGSPACVKNADWHNAMHPKCESPANLAEKLARLSTFASLTAAQG